MKRILLISMFLFLLVLISLSAVSAANETDILSNGTDDIKSFTEIQTEIDYAGVDDTIYLEGHYRSEGEAITVTKSLTFEGRDDAVLDGNHQSDMIYADKPVTMTFRNITFVNSPMYAIATNQVYEGFHVNVENCTFRNIDILAIYTYGGYVTVDNCLFADNFQAISSYGSQLTVRDSNFINNFYCAIESAHTTIVNSNFTNNGNNRGGVGTEFGGAILVQYDGSVSINESRFIKNHAQLLGGAVYAKHGDIRIRNCEFMDNSAFNGAAIYNDGNLEVIASSFISNDADVSAVYNSGVSRFSDSTFKENANYALLVNNTAIVNCNGVTKNISRWMTLDNNLIESDFIKINFNKIDSTEYKSGKKLTIKVINTKNNAPVKNCKVKVVLKNGAKSYTRYLTTNSKGVASLDVSKFKVGLYKVLISLVDSKLDLISIDEIDRIFIYNQYTTVKAPKVKFKYKKSKYFKVTVKGKKSKKAIGKLKIKLKIYTGKKYKVYKVKTNKKGVAKFNTKKLKRGKHKVIITSANSNFYVYKKSLIRIR